MAASRLVECQDCGYQWESTAEDPRCSKADCGRSWNVEPVHDHDQEDADQEDDQEPEPEIGPEPEEDDEDARAEPSSEIQDQEDDGYTPAFSTETVEKDTEPDEPPEPEEPIDGESASDRDEPADDRDEPAEATEHAPAEIELDAETLEPAIRTTFQIAAHRRGPHWELQEDEAGLLADSWTPVLNAYAPQAIREHTMVGAALLATYSVIGPKLAEDKKQKGIEEAAREDDQPTDSIREPVIEPEPEEEPAETIEEPSEPERNGAVGGYANV